MRPYTQHFDVRNEGTVVVFTPKTDEAFAWWKEHVQPAEPWQYLGGGLVIDHRCAWRILDAIVNRFDSN